jgi:tetratricopeptide (TPR) repeat protein
MERLRIALSLLLVATPAAAAVPPVLIPPHADTVSTSSPAAPLLIPGQSPPPDTSVRSRNFGRTAQERYAMGRELERQGHDAAAIAAYQSAVRMDPRLPEANYRMGRLFSNVAQHKLAARLYEAELRIQPDHVGAGRWLGLELAQLGDTAQALAQLRSMVLRRPDDEPTIQALGFALATAGRPEEAERTLRHALVLDPHDGDAWRDLGVVRAAMGNDAGAREAYAQAVKYSPKKDPSVLVDLGNLERRARRYDAALAAYRGALERDSSEALGWRGQVAVYEDMGQPEEAGRAYRAWLARNPSDHALRMQAMEHFDAIGRKDIALELAREGVRLRPKSPEAHLALGMALHESGDDRAALPQLRRAEDLFVRAESSARVGALIKAMRARSPDSLRAFFAADSIANEASRQQIPVDSLHLAPRK